MKLYDQSRPEAQMYHQKAQAAFESGDPGEALRQLVFGFHADPGYKPLYELAAQCLEGMEAEQEAGLFGQVVEDFDSAQPFFRLGYFYIDQQNERLALPFLERAYQLEPESDVVVMELALARAANFDPAGAFELFAGHELKNDFLLSLQKHWYGLLAGKRCGIEQFVHSARRFLEDSENTENDSERQSLEMLVDKMEEAFRRYHALGAVRQHIRDWQFIQYGGAVLYCDEASRQEEGELVAGGRWVSLFATYEVVAEVLYRLKALLRMLERAVTQVIAVDDRDSRILGEAMARILGVGFAIDEGKPLKTDGALVVAADARSIQSPIRFAVNDPPHTVFAFNQHWLQGAPLAADVTGLMSQGLVWPWEHRPQVDPETQEVRMLEPDERPEEAIAEQIASVSEPDPERLQEVVEYYRPLGKWIKGGACRQPRRYPFLKESPVAGTYFI